MKRNNGSLFCNLLGGFKASKLPGLAWVVGWAFDSIYCRLVVGVNAYLLASSSDLGSMLKSS